MPFFLNDVGGRSRRPAVSGTRVLTFFLRVMIITSHQICLMWLRRDDARGALVPKPLVKCKETLATGTNVQSQNNLELSFS